jgi:hypothetical protein
LYYCMVKIFGKIRTSFGEKMLAKKAKTLVRHKQVHNFNTAKNIGIIFDAGNADDFRHVKEFGKYLTSLNIQFTMLGYLNADEIRSDLLFLHNISIFCNKDLDFFFRPSHPDVIEFLEKKFEILIDLSLVLYYPLRFISSLSPADFKVGKYSSENADLDLMIDIHSQPNLEFLIEQIKNYVSILNKTKASF